MSGIFGPVWSMLNEMKFNGIPLLYVLLLSLLGAALAMFLKGKKG